MAGEIFPNILQHQPEQTDWTYKLEQDAWSCPEREWRQALQCQSNLVHQQICQGPHPCTGRILGCKIEAVKLLLPSATKIKVYGTYKSACQQVLTIINIKDNYLLKCLNKLNNQIQ